MGDNMSKGTMVISLDTELAWGTIDKPDSYQNNLEDYKKTREIIDKILGLFIEKNISATWAFVGHLLLESCKKENDIKHPDYIRTNFSHYKNDWFKMDPSSNIEEEPLWYGKDIVEKVINADVYQEIASHSFAHLLYGSSETKKETAISDLEEFEKAINDYNIDCKSFVFPRNQVGFLNELKKFDYITYRGDEPSWYDGFNRYLKKLAHMVDQFFAITPPAVEPVDYDGILNIPASMLYLSMDGFRKYIPLSSRVRKAKKGIDKAIKKEKIFHLWFHPFNLASNSDKLLLGLEEIVKYANEKRDKGLLEIKTMDQVYNEFTEME